MKKLAWKERNNGEVIIGVILGSCLWCVITKDDSGRYCVKYTLKNINQKPYGEICYTLDEAKEKSEEFLRMFMLKVLI